MPTDNQNLPVNPETGDTAGGTITYANEVIAIISGIAANEVEGIAGMCTSGGFSDIIGKNRNVTRGVKAEVGTEEVSIDLYAIIEYGQPIQKVASEVQENVRKSIEAMTSLKVVRVDVHVQGVSFEKEKREVQTNLDAVKWQNLPEGSKPKTREERKNEKKRAKKASTEPVQAAEPDTTAPEQTDAEAPEMITDVEPEDAAEAEAAADPEASADSEVASSETDISVESDASGTEEESTAEDTSESAEPKPDKSKRSRKA